MVRIVALQDFSSVDFDAVIGIYDANGWGTRADYKAETVRTWFEKSSHVAVAYGDDGTLLGWVRALTDGLNTWLPEIVLHPEHQRQGIGHALMEDVIARFNGTAIYTEALNGTERFFKHFGIVPRPNKLVAVSRAPQAA